MYKHAYIHTHTYIHTHKTPQTDRHTASVYYDSLNTDFVKKAEPELHVFLLLVIAWLVFHLQNSFHIQ